MRQLTTSQLKPAEYVRREFVISPPAGTTLEDIQRPDYWAHIAAQLRPWDFIEVRPEDEAFMARLMVRAAERTWARVMVLDVYPLNEETHEGPVDDAFVVGWGGPVQRWRAVRKSDNTVVVKNQATKSDAEAALADYVKALKV